MNHQTIEPLRPAMEKLQEREHEEHSRHHRRLVGLADLTNHLTSVVDNYLKTGVFFILHSAIEALETEGVQVRGVLQEIARVKGRPYVRAEHNRNHAAIELKVPNTKRLQPLVAPLLLVAQTIEDPGRWIYMKGPGIYLNETPGTWVFHFVGAQNHHVFHSFVERCHTDPVNRIILKL